METQKRLGSKLCVGAVGGALVLLVLSACGKPPEPMASSSEKKLVVVYTFDETTGKFNVTFEGLGVRRFELVGEDIDNPLGKLARGKIAEAGVHGVTFATKSSPGCLTGCVGKYCGSTC